MQNLNHKAKRGARRVLYWVWFFALGLLAAEAADTGSKLALRNAAGERVDPFSNTQAAAAVFIFVRPDCPISNRYAPELKRLQKLFQDRGVVWWLVYPDAETTAEAMREHKKEYGYDLPELHDPEHELVRRARARVTPEVAVFAKGQRLIYHGRIDDRFAAFGRARPEATQHDLQDVLEDVIAGRPARIAATKAVGCTIETQP